MKANSSNSSGTHAVRDTSGTGKRKRCGGVPSMTHVPSHIQTSMRDRYTDKVHVELCDRQPTATSAPLKPEATINWRAAPNARICAEYDEGRLTAVEVLKQTTVAMRTYSLRDAWASLERLRRSGISPNTEVHTALISRCVAIDRVEEALQALGEMRDDGALPDAITYHILAQACRRHAMAEQLENVYAQMHKDGFARNAAECGQFKKGKQNEDDLRKFTATCLRKASWEVTTACLVQMREVGLAPDWQVRTSALDNYPHERLVRLQPGEILHELASLGLMTDLSDLGHLLNDCETLGRPDLADDLLREAAMGEQNIVKAGHGHDRNNETIDFRHEALATASVGRYSGRGYRAAVAALFKFHHSRGAIRPNTRFHVSLSDPDVKIVVARCMREIGLAPVDGVRLDGTRNLGWLECGGAAFVGCLQRGQIDVALSVLHEMGEGGSFPDVDACSELIRRCFGAGRLDDARAAFQKLVISEFEPKLALCTAMIEICKQYGHGAALHRTIDALLCPDVRLKPGSYFALIAACQWDMSTGLQGKIDPLVRAAVANGVLDPALGYREAEDVIVIEFSTEANAGKRAEGAPQTAVTPYFEQAMFMYHHSQGYIKPEKKTTYLAVGPEAREAIKRVMRRVGLEPEGKHANMLLEPPLTLRPPKASLM
ncbi:hypothetical protein GCM10023165_05160 [Variovorax defluvii]|uniref:Pentacotripeptide-repeat region of PRORP domain-containing protein n=1 Tax=Variovorax defluvii TaxID=913761 RepID=A0ABP8GWS5_9BURK